MPGSRSPLFLSRNAAATLLKVGVPALLKLACVSQFFKKTTCESELDSIQLQNLKGEMLRICCCDFVASQSVDEGAWERVPPL